MNAQRKNAAIKAYLQLKLDGKTVDEVKDTLSTDPKNYTTEEIAEIADVIFAEPNAGNEGSGTKSPEKKEVSHFEEWKCELKNGEVSKISRTRDRVVISESEAETLNEARKASTTTTVLLYFRPE